MAKRSKKQSSMKTTYKGIGMAMGLILGGCIGLLTGNVVFAGGGMVVGLAIGAALD